MYDVGRCCLEWTVFYVRCRQMLPGVDCLLCMMWADVAWSGLSSMYDVGRCCLEWTVFYVRCRQMLPGVDCLLCTM